MDNLLVDVEILSLALPLRDYFKWSFDNISQNHGPPFSEINFDQTHFVGFCPGVCVLEPNLAVAAKRLTTLTKLTKNF